MLVYPYKAPAKFALKSSESAADLRRIYGYGGLCIAVWTLVLLASLLWRHAEEDRHIDQLAYNEALANFNKDQAFRLWGASHGGVYVPLTERTPANPNLTFIPERDIRTPSGQILTLMNPAYMVRQMMTEFGTLYGAKGRIVSLKPLWHGNAPDPWERQALLDFEKGKTEVLEKTEIDGKPFLRLIRPLFTEPGCLKCHARQGYKLGNIRGGIGVSLPLEPYLKQARDTERTALISHGIIWIIGVGFIALVTFRAKNHSRLRQNSEEKLRLAAQVFQSSLDGILITDSRRRILSVNTALAEAMGYTGGELVGGKSAILSSGRSDRAHLRQIVKALRDRGRWEGELWVRRGSGEELPTWHGVTVVKDGANRVTNYIGIFSDMSESKSAAERIEYLSRYDHLTGLPNRQLLKDYFDILRNVADSNGSRIVLLSCDLDNFKHINDSLGPSIGDDLLQIMATRLKSCIDLSKGDILSRHSGDEFSILLTDVADMAEVEAAVAAVRRQLLTPVLLGGNSILMTVSIGVSRYPDDGDTFDLVFQKADAAVYHAKMSGRNATRHFTGEMSDYAVERLTYQNGLRLALDREEFEIYYQPFIDLNSGGIIGAEALLRWHSPEFGFVPPGRFIPIAEETGLVVPIGEWVLRRACRQWGEWRAAGLPAPGLAVNISTIQLRAPGFLDMVRRALAESGIPADALEIELTESVLISDADRTLDVVRRLKQIGVRLSIDDFGTGYSSLSYLRRLKADKVKIDRSFVSDVVSDADSGTIVKAILQMSNTLGLAVIAEGIETVEQADFLKQHGCTEGQGYLFSRPVPADQFVRLLKGDGDRRP